MENTNPYESPEGDLSDVAFEYSEVKIISASGRIGRLRYLAHAMLLMLGFYALLIPAGLIMTTGAMVLGIVLMVVVYIAMIVVLFMNGVQRLHDVNKSGWFVLLFIVPFLNLALGLYMLFAPGTEGANEYGNPPPPNKTWHKVLAICGLLIPFVIGILAAVSIPAYQEYTQRAAEPEYMNKN